MKEIMYIEAINEALAEEMERDETVFIIGRMFRPGSSEPVLGWCRGLAPTG